MSDDLGGGHDMVVPDDPAELQPQPAAWSPTEAVTYGWARITRDPGIILVLAVAWLVMNGFSILSNILQAATSDAHGDARAILGLIAFVLTVANFLVSTYVTMGWIRYVLKLLRGQPATLGDIFSGGPYLTMLGSTFLFTVVMLAACCVLIAPGVIFMLGCGFFGYLIMDRGAPAIGALQGSWDMTRGHKANLFVFVLLAVLLTIAGILFCGVGMFVSNAVLAVAYAWIYLRINGEQPVPIPN